MGALCELWWSAHAPRGRCRGVLLGVAQRCACSAAAAPLSTRPPNPAPHVPPRHAVIHAQLPADRFRLLPGISGNLSEWGAGQLSFTLAAGHTPGHTAYLLGTGPDATLLAGDAVSLIMPSLSWGAAAARRDDRVRPGGSGCGAPWGEWVWCAPGGVGVVA